MTMPNTNHQQQCDVCTIILEFSFRKTIEGQ